MPAFTEPFTVDLAYVQQRLAALRAAIIDYGYDGYLHTDFTVSQDSVYLYVRVDDEKINEKPGTYGTHVPLNKFQLNETIELFNGSKTASIDQLFDLAIVRLHAMPSRRHRELNILSVKMQSMVSDADGFNPEIRTVFVEAIRNASHQIGRPLITGTTSNA